MRTLITGGAGFVGSHLCERFLERGHEVVCVDNLITGSLGNIEHLRGNDHFSYVRHDISLPLEIDGPIDNILHFASPASPVDYLRHPIPTLKVGSLGTHNTLGLAKVKSARYLLASTSEVYGDPEVHPQREDYWGHVNPVGVRGCFSADTEILTKEGWKFFPDLSANDEVLTLASDGHMEYHRPAEIIKHRYIGELIGFKNSKIDLLVTPNHKMLVRERDAAEFRLIEAYQDITWEKAEMLKAGKWVGEEKDTFELPCVPNAKVRQQSRIAMDAKRPERGVVNLLDDGRRDFLTPLYPRRHIAWYDGHVYCINVPNHVIHVRRNQRALWCGNCYDEAKRFAEAITMAYRRYHGVNTHICRIFNTYGPRMRLDDGRVLPNFMGQALRGESLTIYGDGSQTRSFCHVDDLVDGIEKLLFADFHEPVNLGNPDEVTILEFAREILELSGSRSPLTYKPLPQDDPKVRRPDITRARQLLGWEPKVPRREGLMRTLDYFRGKVQTAGPS